MEDKYLPLPEGVQRVRPSVCQSYVAAWPGNWFWSDGWKRGWATDETRWRVEDEVYHVPAPECNGDGKGCGGCAVCVGPKTCPKCKGEGWHAKDALGFPIPCGYGAMMRIEVDSGTKDAERPTTKQGALYDAARRFVKSSRFEPDSKIQQDLAEAVRQLTPMREDQIEHQAPSPAKSEQERGEVFKVLPPKEIEAHAEALGWTPESEVWKSSHGTIRVVPSGKAMDTDGTTWKHPESSEKCKKSGDTLLPNRRVPVGSIHNPPNGKPCTGCNAKAGEQHGPLCYDAALDRWLAGKKSVPVEGEKPTDTLADQSPREVAALCRAAAGLDYAETIVREYVAAERAKALTNPIVDAEKSVIKIAFKESSTFAEGVAWVDGAKPKPATAWEEFWSRQGVDDVKDRGAMHYGDFNRFVADRERRAVEAARREWGRAQYGPLPSPKPAKSAEEVAADLVNRLHKAGCFFDLTANLTTAISVIAAAIERERGRA